MDNELFWYGAVCVLFSMIVHDIGHPFIGGTLSLWSATIVGIAMGVKSGRRKKD